MTREERQSCICTINTLRRLALNIHGVIDVVDNANCDKLIELLNGGTDKTLEQEPILNKIRAEIMSKDGLEEALEIIDKYKAKSEVKK